MQTPGSAGRSATPGPSAVRSNGVRKRRPGNLKGGGAMLGWKRLAAPSAVMLALMIAWFEADGSDPAAGRQDAERPAIHNMVVVGEKTVYLSHLPMFQDPKGLKQ